MTSPSTLRQRKEVPIELKLIDIKKKKKTSRYLSGQEADIFPIWKSDLVVVTMTFLFWVSLLFVFILNDLWLFTDCSYLSRGRNACSSQKQICDTAEGL
jgi:hypothetical protein